MAKYRIKKDQRDWKTSSLLIFGGTLREFDELALLFVEDLLIELQLFVDVVIPLVLHLVVEPMLGLVIVSFFHIEGLFNGPIEGLRY